MYGRDEKDERCGIREVRKKILKRVGERIYL